jgi:hypothetical protein
MEAWDDEDDSKDNVNNDDEYLTLSGDLPSLDWTKFVEKIY